MRKREIGMVMRREFTKEKIQVLLSDRMIGKGKCLKGQTTECKADFLVFFLESVQ